MFISLLNLFFWSQGKESSREGSQSKETESPEAHKKAKGPETHQKTQSTKTNKEAKGAQSHQETKGSHHSAASHQASISGGGRREAADWTGLGHMYVCSRNERRMSQPKLWWKLSVHIKSNDMLGFLFLKLFNLIFAVFRPVTPMGPWGEKPTEPDLGKTSTGQWTPICYIPWRDWVMLRLLCSGM